MKNGQIVGSARFHSIEWLMFTAALIAPGCGRSGNDGPPAYPARGKLHINGQPAASAQITLHPVNGEDFDKRGCRPSGRVDAEGTFRLTTYEIEDGAPAGDYVVTVYWPAAPDSNEPSPDRLGGKLLDPEESKFQIHIEPGDNEIPAILLEVSEEQNRRMSVEFSDDVDLIRKGTGLEGTQQVDEQ